MSSNLYVFFEAPTSADDLPSVLQGTTVPGYSFWNAMGNTIHAPGERSAPSRCFFYAPSAFRIYVADRAVMFSRERVLPPELAAGEQHLLSVLLGLPQFRLRRWIRTEEYWDDVEEDPDADEQFVVDVISEGTDAKDLLGDRGTVTPEQP